MSPHTPKKTGKHHTDKQWKADGGRGEGRRKTTKHSTQNAPSSATQISN